MSRPRIRTLKPEIWADEKIGRLTRDARLLFIGLITMADDQGRMRAMTPAVCGQVFPYDDDAPRKLEKWFRELEMVGLILRYERVGITYVSLIGWEKHQRINRVVPSSLPAPPNWDGPDPEPTPRPMQPHRKAIPEATRRAVAKRLGAVPGETTSTACHYCGAPGGISWPRLASGKPGSWVKFIDLDLDHVLAAVHGGSGDEDNIVPACGRCNRSKRSREVTEWSRDEDLSRDRDFTGYRNGEVA